MIFENVYLEEHDTTLVIPAKCASTSIKAAILDTYNPTDRLTWFRERLVEKPKGYVFAFVRNPYSRLVSTYLNKITLSNRNFKHYPLNRRTSFEEFVNFVISNPDDENIHWARFYPTIVPEYDIIKIEDFPHAWIDVMRKVKIRNLQHLNKSGKSTDYKSFYTTDLLDKVTEYYKDDLTTFNYEF